RTPKFQLGSSYVLQSRGLHRVKAPSHCTDRESIRWRKVCPAGHTRGRRLLPECEMPRCVRPATRSLPDGPCALCPEEGWKIARVEVRRESSHGSERSSLLVRSTRTQQLQPMEASCGRS